MAGPTSAALLFMARHLPERRTRAAEPGDLRPHPALKNHHVKGPQPCHAIAAGKPLRPSSATN